MNYFLDSFELKSLNEIVGQNHLLPFVKEIIKSKIIPSMIIYSKSNALSMQLVKLIFNELEMEYSIFKGQINKKIVLEDLIAKNQILVIEEIHRLNKDWQEALTMAIERGEAKIIATTTENPFFALVPALRSRMQIIVLNEPNEMEVGLWLKKMIANYNVPIKINTKLLEKIAKFVNLDFNYSLQIVDKLATISNNKKITDYLLESALDNLSFSKPKVEDEHFYLLETFGSSMRNGQIDQALFCLAKLIESRDLLGIESQMIKAVYEEIGLASLGIGTRLWAVLDSAKRVGFPEARIPLSEVTIEICKLPKSNSCINAIKSATEYAKLDHNKKEQVIFKNQKIFCSNENDKILP